MQIGISIYDHMRRQDVEAFRNAARHFASHILVRFGANAERDRAQAEVRLRELLARLRSGEDFAKLAREYSEDPGSARNGGDLGSFGPGQMVPEFDKAVFNSDLNTVIGPVKTQFGYHLVEVTSRTD